MAGHDGTPPVGLYVHVPFCRSICTYCAFAKGEYVESRADAWLDGLEREIGIRSARTWGDRPTLDTIFLGGGTPSALHAGQWRRLGELLQAGFRFGPDLEFTSEANPESLTPEIAAVMQGIGVNRVSLGVQSLDPAELSLLGRRHGVSEVERAVRIVREAGFSSLNLDLMYALPGQDPETFARSLVGVLDLDPDHLSAYCLGLEPGTPLTESVREGKLPEPGDETARDLYDHLVAVTAARGYDLYEISNAARPGHACRHNLRYWERRDVIALGPSAHALHDEHRWANPAPLEAWIAAYRDPATAPAPKPVPESMARFEWIFLNLRLTAGISLAEYETRWGEPFDRAYGAIAAPLETAGLLARTGDRLHLTPEARFVSDAVFAEFAPER